ncbi:D-alanyl-D-alanine carboxypeptidase/D-alanyl-D-alanine endopeptidase [Undibacterium sp. Di27W]|uniref:D-alanyl-D-alanine carboxypeptidase/D-alanyl-D-alanine endopeptidase n=1 Tax=Undibacterium sp. Di27W TaxID=3413036 RepID=UPI003BF0B3EA
MRLIPASLFFVLPLLPALALAQASLPPAVEAAFNKTNVPVQAFSAIVMPANGGAAVLTQVADRPMNPASAMKLVTTLVGLEELGPNFRWKTQILADKAAKKNNDSLTGTMYLRGGGDPNLTIEKLSSMLRNLRNQGLRRLRGDLILDRSYFQPERPDIGAPQFDEFPDAYYNVIPDSLLVNSNLSSISIESAGDKIEARLNTPLDKVKITNHLHFNELPCSAWETEWLPPVIETTSNVIDDPEAENPNAPATKKPVRQTTRGGLEITLNGGFPKRCKITNNINILDRNQYIAHLIRALWQEMGGTWQGEVRDGKTPASATVLTERVSEPLADILRIINKQSDNVMARTLYLTLGAESGSTGSKQGMSHLQAADARIRQWLFKQGINDAGLVLENGAGLSRTERISPQQMAGLLQAGARSNWYAEFASSLPVASLDGTMRRRLKGGPAELRARIKTGTLKDVVAVAGYVRDINDQQWVVVAMINHDEAARAKAALDELINWVAAGRP